MIFCLILSSIDRQLKSSSNQVQILFKSRSNQPNLPQFELQSVKNIEVIFRLNELKDNISRFGSAQWI